MKERIERNIYIDYIFKFVSSFAITDAIWVLYLTYKGLSLWEIGIIEGIFHATGFLCEVPTGAIADLLGRKKVLIVGRLCSLMSCVIMLFATHTWEFAISFIICAWGYNLLSGSEEALIYDSFLYLNREKDYYKVNSRLEVVIEVAQGLAIFVGGILAEQSFVYCYLAAIFIAAISIIPCFFFEEPILNQKREEEERISLKKHFVLSYNILKNNTQVSKIIIFYSIVFTFYTSIYFYGQKYFLEMGLNKIQISIIMFSAGFFSCIGAVTSEKIVSILKDKTKYIATLLIALTIMGLFFNSVIISIICVVIMGYANSLLYPLQSISLNRLIPSEQRATIISVSSMMFSMIMIILFPLIGLLADMYQLNMVFLFIGVLLLVILFVIHKIDKK